MKTKNLNYLFCISKYPAYPEDLKDFPKKFSEENYIGYSDHTHGISVPLLAISRGAKVIEKHFTLNRNGGGPDDPFSMEPADLAALCKDSKTAWAALGNADYGLKSSEQGSMKFRRSLYFVKDLNAGDIITADSVKSVRPGFGLPPKYFDDVIGSRTKRDVSYGTPCIAELLDGFEVK